MREVESARKSGPAGVHPELGAGAPDNQGGLVQWGGKTPGCVTAGGQMGWRWVGGLVVGQVGCREAGRLVVSELVCGTT